MRRSRVRGGDRVELRKAREVMRGLVECPMCGRSGGAMRAGCEVCEKCRAELAPTRLEQFRSALGLEVADIAKHAGVTTMTVKRALRGDPVSDQTAAALEAVTQIPAAVFREGEPSPFRRRGSHG